MYGPRPTPARPPSSTACSTCRPTPSADVLAQLASARSTLDDEHPSPEQAREQAEAARAEAEAALADLDERHQANKASS